MQPITRGDSYSRCGWSRNILLARAVLWEALAAKAPHTLTFSFQEGGEEDQVGARRPCGE